MFIKFHTFQGNPVTLNINYIIDINESTDDTHVILVSRVGAGTREHRVEARIRARIEAEIEAFEIRS